MRATFLQTNIRKSTVVVTLLLGLAVAWLMLWLPTYTLGQQPDRTLVQIEAKRGDSARRIALVIGNGAYTNAPHLKNPPNDARDMAATLKQLGFTVASAVDADQRTMKRLIREFGQQLKTGGQGLFYYAGHGVQMGGHNYLIPANAEILSETDVEDQGVDLNLVLGLIDEAQNGLNIVILDACRNNPFSRSFRSAGSGLAQVDAPTGTLIAYATSPGRVAGDGQGRNGLYTSELLNQMLVTGISVEEMFKRVRAGVQRQTNGQQVPWESSSLIGNFYFASPSSEATATGNESGHDARVAPDPSAFELSYWETIKNSDRHDDFTAYLEKYPDGQFAALARNRVSSLDAAAKSAESKAAPAEGSATEITFWDSIKNSTRVEDFQAYLKRYPNGAFTELANNRIAAMAVGVPESKPIEPVAKNPLEGTTWSGASAGGEKQYEFQFLSNNEVIWRLKWSRLSDPVYKGTWRQTGSTIHMEFPQGQPFGASPVEAEISGDKMSGSWNFGSSTVTWDNGMYKFTVAKQGGQLVTQNPLEGTTWKGDSAGGDKHYEFKFLTNGEVTWNLRWNGDKSYKGTWRQVANTITMDFRPWWTDPVIVTLNGDRADGSWAKAQYKFTLARLP